MLPSRLSKNADFELGQVPAFMIPDIDVGKENIDSEDIVWCGEDGRLDPDQTIRRYGYEPYSVEETLQRALAAPQVRRRAKRTLPDEDHGAAISLVVKQTKRLLADASSRRGRCPLADYDVLLVIAHYYLIEWFTRPMSPDRAKAISLAPLARRALVDVRGRPSTRGHNGEHHEVVRLIRKFRALKDILLVRVTCERNWDRMDVPRLWARLGKALSELGIAYAPQQLEARTVARILK